MCCENTSKNTSIVFWNRAVTACGKSHPLFIKTAVTTYGNAFTAYQISYDNTWEKNIHYSLTESSDNMWKITYTAWWNSSDNICENIWKTKTVVLWKRAVENHIHCLLKQQWQPMEVHPLLIKCLMTGQGKQNPLLFDREQWKYVENYIHCMVRQQWQYGSPSITY